MDLDRMKKNGRLGVIRKLVQTGSGVLTNGYGKGFLAGTIYRGPLKRFCVPGMNCYSCPGALFACPIGSMQSFFAAKNRKAGAYVIGFLATVGLLVGRLICGWLCLFGLIEELLYLIPVPKLRLHPGLDRILRYLKYVMLVLLVVILPLAYRFDTGMGLPFFCKYICPVGTLEAGVPLAVMNAGVRKAVGLLFRWKVLILIGIIASAMVIHRPFCKYLCPLGAFYALFNKVSLLQLSFEKETCVSCGGCCRACKMQVDPRVCPDSPECIRCGACTQACPTGALHFSRRGSKSN